jgi:hypothetical protein
VLGRIARKHREIVDRSGGGRDIAEYCEGGGSAGICQGIKMVGWTATAGSRIEANEIEVRRCCAGGAGYLRY